MLFRTQTPHTYTLEKLLWAHEEAKKRGITNTAASCTSAIDAVARPTGTPIICGEENMCAGCGVATLSISYYDLGKVTGEMAAKILTGEENHTAQLVYGRLGYRNDHELHLSKRIKE